MASGQLRTVISQLRRLTNRGTGCTLTDAQLLDNFVIRRDEASFEVLVWRHGTMVLNLCQRILRDTHEAEDAFQATFLVLARKAGSIGKGESVGSWLYKVAYRVALRVQARTAKRIVGNEPADDLPARQTADEVLWRDLRPVLDEEIDRLPEKYRIPFVLCYLDGHTNEEAAEQLGCPKGTILSRLARGRERLRSRLAQRGLALTAGGLVLALSQNASASVVPAVLVSSTIKAAIAFAAGYAVTGLVSAPVAALTEGVLRTMFLTKVKIATAALLALAVLGTGLGIVSSPTLAVSPDRAPAGERREERDRQEAPKAEAEQRPGEREREVRKPPAFQGKITAISEDGKTLSLEGGAARGEEPKKITVKLADKTTIEFAGLLKDVFKTLKVGDSAGIWYQEGSTDTVAVLHAGRPADLAGKITAMSGDEKSLTVEIPSRERGAPPEKLEIKLTEKTKKGTTGRGEEVKLAVGNVASVWLQEGSKDTAVAVQASRPPADAFGTITAISADGKVLTVESKGRSGEPIKNDVKLPEKTKIEFISGEPKEKKLKVGQVITVWLRDASADPAAIVQVNLQRRSPDIAGVIAAVSADGKMVTIEIQKRGEPDSTKTEIKLTDKTEIEFAGTEKAEEKKLTVGYHGTVWLQEGSKDTAAVFVATKPKERGR